jgi:uncharacterized protein YqeY
MSLKAKINADFLTAMKAKDTDAKAALTSIKAAITVAEKQDGLVELSDGDIIKIISKSIKQREESISIYEKNGRQELADKEAAEAAVLRNYMPAQMNEAEIELALREIIQDMSVIITNPQALAGKSIGEFNKKYNGQADVATVKNIVARILS